MLLIAAQNFMWNSTLKIPKKFEKKMYSQYVLFRNKYKTLIRGFYLYQHFKRTNSLKPGFEVHFLTFSKPFEAGRRWKNFMLLIAAQNFMWNSTLKIPKKFEKKIMLLDFLHYNFKCNFPTQNLPNKRVGAGN
jgi:hypothetical protein